MFTSRCASSSSSPVYFTCFYMFQLGLPFIPMKIYSDCDSQFASFIKPGDSLSLYLSLSYHRVYMNWPRSSHLNDSLLKVSRFCR